MNLEHDGVYKGVPYINLQADVYRPVEDAVNHARYMGYTLPEFYMFRNILWTPESQIAFQKTMKENAPVSKPWFIRQQTMIRRSRT